MKLGLSPRIVDISEQEAQENTGSKREEVTKERILYMNSSFAIYTLQLLSMGEIKSRRTCSTDS
jgi:hypothetical protein